MAKYSKLEDLNSKLAKSEELSEHNKEVLDTFFTKMMSRGNSESYLITLSSRVSSIKELIDFPLDDPEQKDIDRIFAELNSNGIQKKNVNIGKSNNYSYDSKKSYQNFLNKFYRNFIKEKDEGEDETGESIEVSEVEEEPLFNFVADSGKDFKALARERYRLTRELQDLAIKCGIDPERKDDPEKEKEVDRITPHRLRKGFVHHLYEGEDGLSLKRTSNLARHDNTEITDKHYLDIEKEEMRQDYQKVMG